MVLSFAYLAFSALLKLLLGRRRSEFAKDVELLVLRHQLSVSQTRAGDLSVKHSKLVSKHDDLELLELIRTQTQRRHRERTPKQIDARVHQQRKTPSTRMRTRADLRLRRQPRRALSYEMDLRTHTV
jgi:hypothetical protein